MSGQLGKHWAAGVLAVVFAALSVRSAPAQAGGEALVLTVDGPLTPALKTYI